MKRGYSPGMKLAKHPLRGSNVYNQRTGGYIGRYKHSLYSDAPTGNEHKFLDTHHADQVLEAVADNATTVFSSVVNIPAASGESGRAGRRVTIRAINIRFYFQMSSRDATSTLETVVGGAVFRLLVVWDKQANGQAATYDDVTENAGDGLKLLQFNNLSNKNRFHVLRDRFVTVMSRTTDEISSGLFQIQPTGSEIFSLYKKCAIPIEYSGDSGALADISSNNILVFCIWNDSGSVLPVIGPMSVPHKIAISCRVRFTDD